MREGLQVGSADAAVCHAIAFAASDFFGIIAGTRSMWPVDFWRLIFLELSNMQNGVDNEHAGNQWHKQKGYLVSSQNDFLCRMLGLISLA
ncbi:hypothetical protein DSM107133_01093 [Pseudosulfitobacter sp. DSM 107133]|nr:hypothetical protein DSM107133_01093 [Pseudosulfitobacter sp. DSM 107133]